MDVKERKYNTIQYEYEYYYSGIKPVELRGNSKRIIILISIVKKVKIEEKIIFFVKKVYTVIL